MKKLLTIILLSLIALPVFASTTPYRAYYPKTKLHYPCDEVKFTSKGTYCYELVKTTYKSHGIGTLQRWTGLYDSKGVKIFEGDTVATPGIPNGIVTFGITTTFIGWYIAGIDGKAYSFTQMNLPKSNWSTVL